MDQNGFHQGREKRKCPAKKVQNRARRLKVTCGAKHALTKKSLRKKNGRKIDRIVSRERSNTVTEQKIHSL